MPGFKVNIPNPCSENWNAMDPRHNGRFCKSCEKTVIDFTQKTPAQIQQTLLEATGKICGRFKANHVQTPVPVLVPVKPRTGWIKSKWMAFAAMLTLIGINKKVVAQGQVRYTPSTGDEKHNAHKKTATVVHGWVKAIDTQKGLSQVEIRVYSGGKEIAYTASFSNGSFFIDIPENVIWDFKIDIEFNALNYITQVLYDYPVTKDRIKCDITMPVSVGYEEPMLMGAYIMEVPPPPPEHITGELVIEEDPPLIDRPGRMIDADTAEKFAPLEEKTPAENTVTNGFGINAFPNPTAGIFTVDIQSGSASHIQVMDLSGRQVAAMSTTNSREQVNLSGQPNGVYIVRVINTGTHVVRQVKVVKQD